MTGRFGVRRQLYSGIDRSSRYLCNQGAAKWYKPAAALDSATHRSRHRRCGQGKAPSPRHVC